MVLVQIQGCVTHHLLVGHRLFTALERSHHTSRVPASQIASASVQQMAGGSVYQPYSKCIPFDVSLLLLFLLSARMHQHSRYKHIPEGHSWAAPFNTTLKLSHPLLAIKVSFVPCQTSSKKYC